MVALPKPAALRDKQAAAKTGGGGGVQLVLGMNSVPRKVTFCSPKCSSLPSLPRQCPVLRRCPPLLALPDSADCVRHF